MAGKSGWQRFLDFGKAFVEWIDEHREELEALSLWGSVNTACEEARLYAPMHREAWLRIQKAHRAGDGGMEDLILSLYAPDGVGFEALEQELHDSALLQERQREIGEVLASLRDGRYYVAICGALPLVEFVISRAAGKWNQPDQHLKELRTRMHRGNLTRESATVYLELAAVRMLQYEVPEVWKSGPQQVGAMTDRLNRHHALHGTGVGWDDPKNATRAILLLAAVARVADPLLDPSAWEELAGPTGSGRTP